VTGEGTRLFVALELPDVARAELARWRSELPGVRSEPSGAGAGLRPIALAALHVTLCFLGSRPVTAVDQIAAACETVATLPAAEMTLGAPVWLPKRRPRVLAVELIDRHGSLARVQAALSSALQSGGWYEPDARPFLAHVSVARVPRGDRPRAVPVPAPPPLALLGSTVTLYRSRLQPGGARYDALRTVQLRAP
jgi:2'-5' RNA ligase